MQTSANRDGLPTGSKAMSSSAISRVIGSPNRGESAASSERIAGVRGRAMRENGPACTIARSYGLVAGPFRPYARPNLMWASLEPIWQAAIAEAWAAYTAGSHAIGAVITSADG